MKTEYGVRTLGEDYWTDDQDRPFTREGAESLVKEWPETHVLIARDVSPSRVVSIR